MGAKIDGYYFKSTKFEVEPGEEEEINPGRYGRQLSRWLKQQLEAKGYPNVEIVEEDWGRCLMCSWKPMLYVGCGNVDGDDYPPAKEDILWHCFVTAKVFFWERLFRKIDTAPAVTKLYADLGDVLRAEPEITLVEEP